MKGVEDLDRVMGIVLGLMLVSSVLPNAYEVGQQTADPLVFFGIHHILNFLEITMLGQDGWNYLNPIGTCGNMAQAGAVLAVALKTVSPKMKQVAFPSAFSASIFQLRATGMALTGIPGTLLYLNEQLPLYILVNLVSFAVAFGLTWMFGYKKEQEL